MLRTLAPLKEGATGREIAQLAGLDPHTALKALSILRSAGLVERRVAGPAFVFTLNRRHRLWKDCLEPALEAERMVRNRLFRVLSGKLRSSVVSASVFGSAARDQDTAESDLDVCLIVAHQSDKRLALDIVEKLYSRVAKEFGRRLAPLAWTEGEFRRSLRKAGALVRAIRSEGLTFLGPELKGMFHDETNRPSTRSSRSLKPVHIGRRGFLGVR
ncbi:MAG: nucleotidyltransferase domain-containing protein [Planctomycetes bacterium]|nr:nucleotidyltransferase domain-containing protein [Planctomycetota bacterium]